MDKQVFVTKPFFPPLNEYIEMLEKIYKSQVLTNQGECLKELESKLKQLLNVENLHYVTNGTIALQIALEALGIRDGEIITTPFSYVATTSSILWQRCTPVFCDIEPYNFTMDPNKIKSLVTDKTKAIMPVHVFGYACDVDAIQKIADKYDLRVIYDAAHAFGVKYKGRSLLSYGDISTLSFHATKLFHTVEGGACVVNREKISERVDLIKRFGHNSDEHFCLGINAKQSELHAAMGIVNLRYFDQILRKRKKISDLYENLLRDSVIRPSKQTGLEYNYSYFPVIFENEDMLLKVFNCLNENNIFPRRYFYPSLNTLPYVDKCSCPISEDISRRIACLPLYPDLSDSDIKKICDIMLNCIGYH